MRLQRVGLSVLTISFVIVAIAPLATADHNVYVWRKDPTEESFRVHTGTTVSLTPHAEIDDDARSDCDLTEVYSQVYKNGELQETKKKSVSGDEAEPTFDHTFNEEGDISMHISALATDPCTFENDEGLWKISVRDNFKPTAKASVSPSGGPVSETFTVDASRSTDDDDDDDSLEYRADWQNDGSWDTGWKDTNTKTDHSYPDGGKRTIAVEVRDPHGATDCCVHLTVKVDGKPTADFDVSPDNGHGETEYTFDASPSKDHPTSSTELEYRWDWTSDGVYDTTWSTDETATHTYGDPGDYDTKLQVRDQRDQTGTKTKTISVTHKPEACFEVDRRTGTTETEFKVDASCSSDPETNPSNIEVRWDWTDDGTYDTSWRTDKTASHSYESRGTKTIRLQVEDGEGFRATTTKRVRVLPQPLSGSIPPGPIELVPGQEIHVNLPDTRAADCLRIVTEPVVLDASRLPDQPGSAVDLLVPEDSQIYHRCSSGGGGGP